MIKKVTEPDAKIEFLKKVPRNYFDVHEEVQGTPKFIKPIKRLFHKWGIGKEKNEYRIDFVLCPTKQCLAIGWDLGPIGVEVKKYPLVGKDAGKAISQMMDYQIAEFRLPDGDEKELSMIFLYSSSASKSYAGTEASIMMQEGIGLVRTFKKSMSFQLVHANGNCPIFDYDVANAKYSRPKFGYKTGHR